MTKIIAFNVLIFCALMFLMMLAPPTIFALKDILRPATPADATDIADVAALRDDELAQQSQRELGFVRQQYRDFVVQRSSDFAGEAITVENGIRRTVAGPPHGGAGSPVWFFGGSTTWGLGVSDAYTFPSMFAQQSGRETTNYGEIAYTSRQSLAYLQGVYLDNPTGHRTVVFYDGINDLMHGCNPTTTSINQTAHEPRYQAVLRRSDEPFTFRRLFGQLIDFTSQASGFFGLSSPIVFDFTCAEDPARAQAAANNLVTVWTHAQRLVEANGDRFIAVLQPASFISANVHPIRPGDPYNGEFLAEYQAVFPLMQEALASSGVTYIDLTHIYDDCSDCYYDPVHAGPVGHQLLAEALIPIVP